MKEFKAARCSYQGGFAYQISCNDVWEPKVQYYIEARAEDDSVVGIVGTPAEPIDVPMVSVRTQAEPALPGAQPPTSCAAKECPPGVSGCKKVGTAAIGDSCSEDAECQSGLECEDAVRADRRRRNRGPRVRLGDRRNRGIVSGGTGRFQGDVHSARLHGRPCLHSGRHVRRSPVSGRSRVHRRLGPIHRRSDARRAPALCTSPSRAVSMPRSSRRGFQTPIRVTRSVPFRATVQPTVRRPAQVRSLCCRRSTVCASRSRALCPRSRCARPSVISSHLAFRSPRSCVFSFRQGRARLAASCSVRVASTC